MRIVNRTRGTLLGTRIHLADDFWGRFRGYLGRDKPRIGEGILLVPCNAVHSYGMSFPLDVIFLDSAGSVLEVIPEMEPWTRSSRVGGARYVLEVPPGTIRASGTSVGDALTWSPAPEPSLRKKEIA